MAKQIFYSVRRRDFLYLQGIEPNENYKAGAKSPTMGTPHISADYRSIWGKKERLLEPLTLTSYIKIILEEYRWEDRLPDDLAILYHVDKRYFLNDVIGDGGAEPGTRHSDQ